MHAVDNKRKTNDAMILEHVGTLKLCNLASTPIT